MLFLIFVYRVIHEIVHGKLSKEEATEKLMMRELKDEFNFVKLN
jgi:hypothetical protein